ncbi:MAG: hypothetical protein N4A49_02235 [Marinifilaceae bacterium]|jgi:uncharacterized protein (TIGR02145 family)|nr:hypothetical protein [Marinifilaceae bacterium]
MKKIKNILFSLLALSFVMTACDDEENVKNHAPSSPELMLPMIEGNNVSTLPLFQWRKSKDVDQDQVKYTLYLSEDEDFTEDEIISKEQVEIKFKQKTPLKSSTKYYWKVLVYDGKDGETYSEIRSFVTSNSLPSIDGIISPVNGQYELDKAVMLEWESADDRDHHGFTYNVYVGKSKDLTEDDLFADNIKETRVIFDGELATDYFWKVVVIDSEGGKTETSVSSFSTKYNIPKSFKLLSPEDKDEVYPNVAFSWQKIVALDGTEVSYSIYISEDATITNEDLVEENIKIHSYNKKLEANKTYYWQVKAKDVSGLEVASKVYSIIVRATDSSKVNLVAPANQEVIYGTSLKLKWDEYTDLSGGEVTYNVYYGLTEVMTLAYKKGLKTTECDIANLRGGNKYYWRVDAVNSDLSIVSSLVYSFTTMNNPPSKSEISNDIIQYMDFDDAFNVKIKWTESIDPDKERKGAELVNMPVKYELYLSEDSFVDSDDLVQKELDVTNYKFTTLEYAKNYWLKVVAVDKAGDKVDSEIVKFRTRENTTGVSESTWTDARDGKTYKTVTIDGVTWMAENYAYMPFIENPDNVSQKCLVYGSLLSEDIATHKANPNYEKYGVLYSGDMMETIAPEGWHVASVDEWKELMKKAGMTKDDYDGIGYDGTIAQKLMNNDGSWKDSSLPNDPTNDLKLSVMPAGYNKGVDDTKTGYTGLGEYVYIRTSDLTTKGDSYESIVFKYSSAGIKVEHNKANVVKMVVRLVKNQ